ncbi:non-ribosomal peptide synthetase [Rhizohabitans arisaemae]|uniref:non-ribosomal peptide synthetase n=1 Tax=Rhizohabitans arisaemae TaxID=2720610 RepID=UPI0024B0FC6F|nr:amino acid adenylation domain-containing protein [Rhizohabitans arisaemae]
MTVLNGPDDVRSPSPPDLPIAAVSRAVRRNSRRIHRLDPGDWRALTGHVRDIGADPDTLLVAAFAEVIRSRCKSPEFTLAYRAFRTPVKAVTALGHAATFAAEVLEVRRSIARAVPGPDAAGLPVVFGALAQADADAPLSVGYTEDAGGLELWWDFDAEAFPPGLIDGAVESFQALLHRLTDSATWAQRRPDPLPEADRALIAQVNDTAGPIPSVLLHEIVAAQAEARPDAEAVVDGRRRLSYGELARYANRIGRRLREAGAVPGELVAIVMEKGWEQYAAVYGVLTSGAAYLPIDAGVPAERLARLVERGRVRHILTQSWLDERLTWPAQVTRHRVDQEFETGDASPPPSAQSPGDLAYAIFTSGSTGEPKGVMVDHRGVVNLITDVNARFGVGPEDRAFGISGLHFDASIYDVFGVPAAGGTVVLPDPFERAQPDRWTDRVRTESVTLWNSVPAIMEMIVGQAEIRDDRPLESLRLAVLSGDWIPLTLPRRLRAQAGNVNLIGSGGPTETICWSVFYEIGEVDPAWTSIPYGKPITNQRYYIVDGDLRQRPVWVPGQMAVASPVGLAHGYFADEVRTAAQFVTLPETGERAYLTGDIGRYLPDGNIEILGREDHQVKIQGYRIELGEIEAALREHPSVEAAVVVAPKNGFGVRRLHAYLVGRGVDTREVRSALRAVLPSYMVPSSLDVLDALPLTRNGKIDRLSLTERAGGPAPAVRAAVEPDRSGEPRNALERLICRLMSDVLGGEQVDRNGNFLRLGGDSLSGTRLAYNLRELLDVEVPLRHVFDNPVVADLARVISAHPVHGTTAVETAELIEALGEETEVAEPVPVRPAC